MAVGTVPYQIRSMPLAELDAVTTEYGPEIGKVLSFRLRGESKPRVWAVNDVDKVRNLIESARTAAGVPAIPR